MADQINNKLQQFLIKEDYDGAIDMLKQAFENNSENYSEEVERRGQSLRELNNPEDIKRIEDKLRENGLD